MSIFFITFHTVLVTIALSLSLSYAADDLVNKETWAFVLVGVLAGILLISLVVIHRLPQSPLQLAFRVITKL